MASPSPVTWHIQLLGVLEVASTSGGPPITSFRTRTTGSLLAYLAYHKGQPLPREAVADAVWPGVPYDEVRNRFNSALSHLRVLLATPEVGKEAVFVGDTLTIALNPDIFTTDVAQFENAVKRARRTTDRHERFDALSEAIGFYARDLLLGRYEEWVEAEQDKLREIHAAAALERDKLAQALLSLPRPTPKPARALFDTTTPPPDITFTPTVPRALTHFFGRAGEIDRLSTLITDSLTTASGVSAPLLTLTGMGGIGKSRLAAETARRVLDAFHGRAWFVELADATQPREIWVLLRAALKLAKENEENAAAQVVAHLSSAPSLLVLDNMEQFVVSGQAVGFINELRSRLPYVCLLITSRHIIGAYGEQVFPLGGMLFPADWAGQVGGVCVDGVVGIANDTAFCVGLFADRARTVSPSFTLTPHNQSAVLRLCQVLEGIPLAIELAAARCNLLTPVQLLHQVEDRFALLKSARRDIPDRHRSLHAAVQTSYQMLSPTLQCVFRALSVFRGGWTIEAARAVCDLDAMAVWEALGELNERSLIQTARTRDGDDSPIRFRILDTLRDFGAGVLQSEEAEERLLWERHRLFFARLAETSEVNFSSSGTPARQWFDVLDDDHDNLRAALDSTGGSALSRLHLAINLHRFWLRYGYTLEGKARLTHCVEQAGDAPAADRAKAFNILGALAWATGAPGEARAWFSQALTLFEQIGDLPKIAAALNNLGAVSMQNSDFDTARASYTRSLALYRDRGDTVGQGRVLTNLGGVLIYLNDWAGAAQVLEEALGIQRSSEDAFTQVQTLQSLAEIDLCRGELRAAAAWLCESLSLRRNLGERSTFWDALTTVARLLVEMVKLPEACIMLGAAEHFLQQVEQSASTPANAPHVQKVADYLYTNVPNAAELWAAGAAMPFDHLIDFALKSFESIRADCSAP